MHILFPISSDIRLSNIPRLLLGPINAPKHTRTKEIKILVQKYTAELKDSSDLRTETRTVIKENKSKSCLGKKGVGPMAQDPGHWMLMSMH